VVASSPETISSSSSSHTQTHVTLRPRSDGRLGQLVSHTSSDEYIGIPDLLDVPDDDDDDDIQNNVADALEEEFFGQTDEEDSDEQETKTPVRICVY
jgi:hypothetical protein